MKLLSEKRNPISKKLATIVGVFLVGYLSISSLENWLEVKSSKTYFTVKQGNIQHSAIKARVRNYVANQYHKKSISSLSKLAQMAQVNFALDYVHLMKTKTHQVMVDARAHEAVFRYTKNLKAHAYQNI